MTRSVSRVNQAKCSFGNTSNNHQFVLRHISKLNRLNMANVAFLTQAKSDQF